MFVGYTREIALLSLPTMCVIQCVVLCHIELNTRPLPRFFRVFNNNFNFPRFKPKWNKKCLGETICIFQRKGMLMLLLKRLSLISVFTRRRVCSSSSGSFKKYIRNKRMTAKRRWWSLVLPNRINYRTVIPGSITKK